MLLMTIASLTGPAAAAELAGAAALADAAAEDGAAALDDSVLLPPELHAAMVSVITARLAAKPAPRVLLEITVVPFVRLVAGPGWARCLADTTWRRRISVTIV